MGSVDALNGTQVQEGLSVAIIGAGIAGLSAAIGLRKAGHKVTVYERSAFKQEIGAAVSVPPNATRILDRWGFDWVNAKPAPKEQIRIADAQTLKVIYKEVVGDMEKEYGSKWVACHRVDLHGELRRVATTEEGPGKPVQIRLGSKVVGLDAEGGVLTLESGEKVSADLVVVADGTHSSFLKEVVGREVPMVEVGRSAYRSLVPFDRVMAIPELRKFFENEPPGFFNPTLGGGGAAITSVTYPCRNGELLNWAVLHPTKVQDKDKDATNWNHPATKEDMLECLCEFHPAWRKLCMEIGEVKLFKVMVHEPLERICRGKAVVIGDTAHPMLPTHGQGAAMAIEEGAALETIFGSDMTPQDVGRRLDVFEKLRLPRGMVTQVISNKWFLSKEVVEEAVARVDPNAQIPAHGTGMFSKSVRDHYYPYDAHAEARKALQAAGI